MVLGFGVVVQLSRFVLFCSHSISMKADFLVLYSTFKMGFYMVKLSFLGSHCNMSLSV